MNGLLVIQVIYYMNIFSVLLSIYIDAIVRCYTNKSNMLLNPLATIVTSFSFAVRETASLGIMGALRCPP